MIEGIGRQGDLKIEIRPSDFGTWNWQVWKWNPRPSKWNRQSWLPIRSGTTLTEWGARRAANGAVKKIRELETREAIVYYDPPRQAK